MLCFQFSWSQTIDVQGKIVSGKSDLENINIYNSTSKKGTITNAAGEFLVSVKLNDVLKISSIIFKEVTVIINTEIIKNKALTLLVTEKVNSLDEVVLLSHDLSGALLVDVESAEYFKPIPVNISTMNALDIEDIRMTKTSNPIMTKGEIYNGFNPIEILKLFGVKFNKKKKPTYQELQERDTKQVLDLSDRYSPEFIHENFKIPFDKIEAFHAYLKAKEFDYTLLKNESEVQLLEFVLQESKLFLKELDAQN